MRAASYKASEDRIEGRKYLARLASTVKAAWAGACKADGIPVDSTFVVFSKGERNCKVVLTEAEVLEIFASSESNVDLGESYGIAPTTVSAIRNQRNWKYLTGHMRKRPRR
jgi:hypothetical protein